MQTASTMMSPAIQVGDRLKALKSLLKSGDTKSIIYYAGVSRSRDIYILAANYLQNLDWHDNPQVGRNKGWHAKIAVPFDKRNAMKKYICNPKQ